MSIDLLPRNLVVGAVAPTLNQPFSGAPKIGARQLTSLYTALAEQYSYRALQMTDKADGCQIAGATQGDFVSVQPPIIQFAENLESVLSLDAVGDKAMVVMKTITDTLRQPLFNLGIRLIYFVPAPDSDPAAFVRTRLAADLATRAAGLGPNPLWMGVKLLIQNPTPPTYTVTIEPSVQDQKMIYVDVDAQFQTAVDPLLLKTQILSVEQYCMGPVRELLEGE